MPLNIWPFNIKAKKLAKVEAANKKRKKKILLGTLIPGSALVIGGTGVGLYFILKPKKKPEPGIEGFNMTGTNWKGYSSGSLTITTSNDEATITENNSYNAKNLIIPNIVTDGKKEYILTDIGERAFRNCQTLAGDLTIGDNVVNIGDNAFELCTKLTGLIIGNSVESIGKNAFSQDTKFSGDLTIPNSVISIKDWAFSSCHFNGKLTIGDHVENIGISAFSSCTFTRGLTIPDSVIVIGNSAFNGCIKFNEPLVIGDHVENIGSNAFSSCQFTGELTIPNSVIAVGDGTFRSCSKLTTLNLNHLAGLGTQAFNLCSSLTQIISSYDAQPNWGGTSIFTNVSSNGTVNNTGSYSTADLVTYLKSSKGLPNGWTAA